MRHFVNRTFEFFDGARAFVAYVVRELTLIEIDDGVALPGDAASLPAT